MIPPDAAPEFLAACGWAGARIEPLAGDASFRRYFRVFADDGRQAVLMDAPPPHEDPRPFVAVAEWLASIGLSRARHPRPRPRHGLLLLGDFGNGRLREELDVDAGARARTVRSSRPTSSSTSTAIRRWPACRRTGSTSGSTRSRLFTDWYAPRSGSIVDADALWRQLWREVLAPVAADGLGPVTVLRDYHAENVMLVEGRGGRRAFRPARFPGRACRSSRLRPRLGARRRAPRRRPRDRARDDRPLPSPPTGQGEAFERAYWALAAQRNTRILGVFVRLWKRDGKPGYRQFQPRMWGLLERDLAHPSLAPVRAWFDANIPAEHAPLPWSDAA